MEDIDLNNSPDLTMEEITKQLFNNEVLSDIQFYVDDKVLFAHSWELMKRSIVFREQFKGNLGENKLIPIDDITYNVFHEFLRFIYTDECTIEDGMISEMLKLAVRYKIVKLENKVINLVSNYDTDLKLLEASFMNNYELNTTMLLESLIENLVSVVQLETFFLVQSHVVEEILKYNRMPSEMTEFKLFNAFVGWMNRSCEINQTPRSLRRSVFGNLLRLIRFPIMTIGEFRLCTQNNPDLFTSDDIATITVGPQCKNSEWIAEPRLKYVDAFENDQFPSNRKWVTKFNVSNNLILCGLRYGSGFSNCEICISGKNRVTQVTKALHFNFLDSNINFNTISLGESIKLKPNVDYTVEIKYITDDYFVEVYYRKPNTSLIVTGPTDVVSVAEASDNLFEICIKLSDE